jgi:hypothetical protein
MNQKTVQISVDYLAKWILGLTVTILLSAVAGEARGDASEGKGLVYDGQFMHRLPRSG